MTNLEIENAYMGSDLVDKIYLGDELIYPTTPVYSAMPLTFDIISGGTIGWVKDFVTSGAESKTIEYRINNGNWSSITSSEVITTFSVNSGDRVEFRGNNTAFGASGYSSYFVASGIRLNVEGNIMSLLNSSGYQNMTAMTSANTYAFYKLFQNVGIVSAENLILPATTLASNCYSNMFKGCSSLTTAPELPAKTMSDACYASMFEDCTSLTTAPEISAGTSNRCFFAMFRGCTNLTTPPILPAKRMSDSCYYEMFSNCTSLTTAPELPATTLATYCYQGMFKGCSSLKTAPELLATSRYTGCYNEMFYGSGVNYIKCLLSNPGSASAGYCTNWLMFAPDAGTFVKNPNASWSRGYSGIPTGWTVQDADI